MCQDRYMCSLGVPGQARSPTCGSGHAVDRHEWTCYEHDGTHLHAVDRHEGLSCGQAHCPLSPVRHVPGQALLTRKPHAVDGHGGQLLLEEVPTYLLRVLATASNLDTRLVLWFSTACRHCQAWYVVSCMRRSLDQWKASHCEAA